MKTILLVDDDEPTRASLQVLLESERYRVFCSANGANALAQIAMTRIDLVITDSTMPILDGVKLCEQLRISPRFRSIPIVLVSADPEPDGQALWNAFFRKPFRFPVVNRIVHLLLGMAGQKSPTAYYDLRRPEAVSRPGSAVPTPPQSILGDGVNGDPHLPQ